MPHPRVCAGCLVTKVKMYNTRSSGLLTPYQQLTGLQLYDYIPHKLCWECAGLLNKFNMFRLKCERAYTLLQDTYIMRGEIKSQNLKKINRKSKGLCSNLIESCTNILSYDPNNKLSQSETVNGVFTFNNDEAKSESRKEHSETIEKYNIENILFPVKVELHDETDVKTEIDVDNCADVMIEDTCEDDNLSQNLVKNKKEIKKIRKKTHEKIKRKKVIALELGMKEESLTQEQQMQVISDRQKSESYVNSRHGCTMCYRTFNDPKAFSNHTLLHDAISGNYVCDVCKLRYKSRLQILKHILRQHLKKYTCLSCKEVFYTRDNASKHFAWHNGVVYTCNICNTNFQKPTSLRNHTRKKHASGHVCGRCGLTFVSEKGLRQHNNMVHLIKREGANNSEDSGRYCEACKVQFLCRQAWTKHILTSPVHSHERHLCANGCDHCGEVLPDADALSSHRAQHRSVYKKDKPIKCEQCGVSMSSYREYRFHFERSHPNETRTLFAPAQGRAAVSAVCEQCGKGFKTQKELQTHSYNHSGERPYKCGVCSKSFMSKYVLKIHTRIHTKETPYVCNICGQGFTDSGNMMRHRSVHSDEKPYSCHTCGKGFKRPSAVKTHVEYVHMKKPWPKRDRAKKKDVIKEFCSDTGRETMSDNNEDVLN